MMTSVSVMKAQTKDQKFTQLLHRAQGALTGVIVHDVFSPPVASRIYVYPHLACYVVLVRQSARAHRLDDTLKDFPKIPAAPAGKISYPLAALYAFLYTGQHFIFSEKIFADSGVVLISRAKALVGDPKVEARSLAYGKMVGDSILSWSQRDQYASTRSLRRFTHSREEGKWLPTPPAYFQAVEPNWARLRPMVIDSVGQFRPPAPLLYSTDTASLFHRQAREVYAISQSLTPEQRQSALFWDCNPFYVNVSGHLIFASKKLSPGGHWMSIAGIASRQIGLDNLGSSIAYLYTAIAIYDGFLCCWAEKYRSNYIRPETYINARIDESWRPLLQTPPFPEYTSGHSVISGAAATVLTALFGDNFRYTDVTEEPYGLPGRNFNSFYEAAEQAAISRLYGGIHFHEAVSAGLATGKSIGAGVARKLDISPF
ncbi:MAG TPA: vanadium-dependent haloperoxidase [Chitinophagaceae bacterium]|nr:vanadium-dependent haloperoxidase [Chitinophagaceae bacterium]